MDPISETSMPKHSKHKWMAIFIICSVTWLVFCVTMGNEIQQNFLEIIRTRTIGSNPTPSSATIVESSKSIVDQFIQDNTYQSRCDYPFYNISTMDIMPSEQMKPETFWKVVPTHHLPSTQLLREKKIRNPLFYPGLSLRQRQEQAKLILLLHEFMNSIGILAVGYGGIVVGALRHHGFVPWDSDVDFLIPTHLEKAFVDAVKKHMFLLTKEWGVFVCRPSGKFYHWTSLPEIVNVSDSSPFRIQACPKDLGEPQAMGKTAVVPSVEMSFTNLTIHSRAKPCSFPRDLRMMFTEGGVPFWTCDKLIKKWTYAMRSCTSGWNQPTRDDQSCGKQLFAIPQSKSNGTNNSSADATTQSITAVANYSFGERKAQWMKLIDKSDLNPDGLNPDHLSSPKGDCAKLLPVYNFADVKETHTTAAATILLNSSVLFGQWASAGGAYGSGVIVTRYARSILRTIPLDDWSCYSWKSGHLVPEGVRINTTAGTTLLLSDDVFNANGTFTKQLTRNHTLVVSARHRVLLDYYPPSIQQQKKQNQTSLQNILKEEEEGVFCELHITTRNTEDDALWAKVMGYNCYKKYKDGKNSDSQQQSQYRWCYVRGDNRRRWTRIEDIDLDKDYPSNEVI